MCYIWLIQNRIQKIEEWYIIMKLKFKNTELNIQNNIMFFKLMKY